MAEKVFTVSLNEEEQALLEKRIEYLKEQRGVGARVTYAEAIRHAICHTGYSRGKKKGTEDEE